ncbi:MAG: hypothetical protein ABIH11_05110 [Candidatus Altiarchaeota archaeon]
MTYKQGDSGRVNLPPGGEDVLSKLDTSSLMQLTPGDKVGRIADLTITAARRMGTRYEDAANVVIPIKWSGGRGLDAEQGDDVKLLDRSIEEARGSSSDPDKMQVVREIYLRLRALAFPKED